MKKCNYCDSTCKSNVLRCPYCGGNDFSPIGTGDIEPPSVPGKAGKALSLFKQIVLWIITVFVIILFLSYVPHYSSFIYLLSLPFILPLERLKEYRTGIISSPALRVIIPVVLIFAAMMLAPEVI